MITVQQAEEVHYRLQQISFIFDLDLYRELREYIQDRLEQADQPATSTDIDAAIVASLQDFRLPLIYPLIVAYRTSGVPLAPWDN